MRAYHSDLHNQSSARCGDLKSSQIPRRPNNQLIRQSVYYETEFL